MVATSGSQLGGPAPIERLWRPSCGKRIVGSAATRTTGGFIGVPADAATFAGLGSFFSIISYVKQVTADYPVVSAPNSISE